jgi:hypothetical protein
MKYLADFMSVTKQELFYREGIKYGVCYFFGVFLFHLYNFYAIIFPHIMVMGEGGA